MSGSAEKSFQFAPQHRAIDRFRLLPGDAANGSLLNELALESEERREFVVTRLQRLDFFRNPEQLAQKIFDVRRERDDQLGLLLGGPARRIQAGIHKPCMQAEIGRQQLIQKAASS